MRIGLFGGTFDPVHHGHLIMAERCREDAKLDAVWFVPSYRPPHKTDRAVTRFESRVEMLQLAVASQPLFRIEQIEKELPPPSYTVETVAALQAKHPEHAWELIVGGDVLPDLAHWLQPQRLLSLTSLLVVPRPGTPLLSADQLAVLLKMPRDGVRLTTVISPPIDIASREIRTRVGRGQTIRFMLPRAVEEYIREKKLYAAT